jgi:putative ABC transport system substrate-binding protein
MGVILSRRQFALGAGAACVGAATGPLLAACERLPFQTHQPARVPRIGVLSRNPTYTAAIQAFRRELRQRGYVEAQNVTIDYREYGLTTEQDALPADLVAELARLQVDVMVVQGMEAIAAAQGTSTTIPLVLLATDTGGKRLELLVAAVPGIARVAVLWNPASPISAGIWREVEVAAGPLGVQVQPQAVSSPADLDRAFEVIAQGRADALLVVGDPPNGFINNTSRARRILDFAAAHRLPAIYPAGAYASGGGLIVHAPNDADLFPRAATRVVQVLEDPRQVDRTIERSTKFDLTVNLATARALGLTIAPAVLSQATEVVP